MDIAGGSDRVSGCGDWLRGIEKDKTTRRGGLGLTMKAAEDRTRKITLSAPVPVYNERYLVAESPGRPETPGRSDVFMRRRKLELRESAHGTVSESASTAG